MALMAAIALVHGAALVAAPSAPLIAIGVWWSSNTIAHNFIHRPFFRSRGANACFAAYLSVLLGIPQALWRERHLAHHAGVAATVPLTREIALQTALVLALWLTLAVRAPMFFALVYAPGYLAGLLLCALHGHYEHARGTTSHYGALYNLLCFNDGYHVEHHLRPGVYWANLPQFRSPDAAASRWPAPLRWMDAISLEGLERLVLRSRLLQAFVLQAHRSALDVLTRRLRDIASVAIVGGGLFPRTALILKTLLPSARLTIIDASRANLDRARAFLEDEDVRFVNARYTGAERGEYDLVIVPLAFQGDRAALYDRPPARALIVHDWIWRRKGVSRIVSLALFKRVNLVCR